MSCIYVPNTQLKVIGPKFDALAGETPEAVFVKVDVDQCRATATRFKVQGLGFRVQGSGFRV